MSKDVKGDLTMELLKKAITYAREKGHPQVYPAHLLVAFTKDPEAKIFCDNIGLDITRLQQFVTQTEASLDQDVKTQFSIAQTPEPVGTRGVATSEASAAILLFATKIAHANKKDWASYSEIAGALANLGDPYTKQAFLVSGIQPKDITEAITNKKAKWSPHKPVVKSTTKVFNKADESKVALGLSDILKAKVFDQDKAIDALHSSMKIAAAGLKDENKPRGSYLFAGPTGVGKTELAKQLAKARGVKIIRIDMSEYMEEHSVARLIGSPPGYVGHGEEGILTQLADDPDAVVLFDEIEKAHPKVFNSMLQIMDDGHLTTGDNKSIDFRQATIIMTSNVGARDVVEANSKPSIGFATGTSEQQNKEKTVEKIYDDAINAAFAPEFRNRLDGIIKFDKLSTETIHKVTRKFIAELNELQGPRDHSLEIIASEEAIVALTKKGYDENMGARPLQRTIAKEVKEPLAQLILADKLENSLVEIEYDAKKDSFFLNVEPISGNEEELDLPKAKKDKGLDIDEMAKEEFSEYMGDEPANDNPEGGYNAPEEDYPQCMP